MFYVASGSFAQLANVVYNNGATISVMPGALFYVNEDSLTNGSGVITNSGHIEIVLDNLNNSGTINNQGYIDVQGNLTNNATISASGDSILLFGDWINNGTYTTNNSLVDLNGSAQFITGTAVTNFDNLTLDPSQSSVKRQTINTTTSGILSLNSSELATDVNQMMVTNTNPSAITYTSGFVSSVPPNGNLAWATNSTSNYLFPVGSPSYDNGPSLIRPVQFTPAGSNSDVYQAVIVKGDPSAAGYNVNALDDSLCAVNPKFYHLLAQPTGTDAAALTMFYDPATDETWSDEAHWATPGANVWNYLGVATSGTSGSYNTVTVNGVSNFVPAPFALARKRFTVYAGPSTTITLGQSYTINPVLSSPGYDSISWTPNYNLSCDTCLNPVASPAVSTQYAVTVYEGNCSAMSSIDINVSPDQLLIPTAFSPNGDNSNDYFHVLNKNLSSVDLQVYNRWGQKVYETTDVNDRGWDGTFQGVKQEMAVYVWQCQYQLAGTSQLLSAKGNVTLLR